MSFLDWVTASVPLLLVISAALYTQRYVKSVADFVAANRSAGRYLLCIAGTEGGGGAIVFVLVFEIFSHSGFTYSWWGAIGGLVSTLIGITGFVSYRYRETRAMTLAQFFEIRYDKSFRLYTGLLGFASGLLNFGIIPSIGARTMVYLLGLPDSLRIFSLTIPTYVPIMALFLALTLTIALSGGVITVMVINTLDGMLSQVFYLVIIFTILALFSWTQIHSVLVARPPGQSLINPFDTAGVKDFNIWNAALALCTGIIATSISWQNSGPYKSAALTPHEGRMAGLLSMWQGMGKSVVITLLALAAMTYLHHPDFAAGAAHVQETVHHIADKQVQEEMEIPIAVSYLLPIGVKGLFCAALLMGIFGGDATALHSWGSIFIQDILVPLRKKPFGPRAHLWILRCSIFGVALFAFLWGTFFHVSDYLLMYFGLTQAIFTGGAGSAIIGGLYWKKGTAAGAWSGFITGSVLAVSGIVIQQVYAHYFGHAFFLNGIQIGFFSSIAAVAIYMLMSLLTCKEDFNIDRMLHRGAYASLKTLVGDAPIEHQRRKPTWGRLIGFDDNFTRTDKWIAGSVFWWSTFWVVVFIVVSLWNLVWPWSTESWARYYHFTAILMPLFFAIVTSIWFTWGGIRDMRALFRRLRHQRINALDDGTVINNQNLDELTATAESPGKGMAPKIRIGSSGLKL